MTKFMAFWYGLNQGRHDGDLPEVLFSEARARWEQAQAQTLVNDYDALSVDGRKRLSSGGWREVA